MRLKSVVGWTSFALVLLWGISGCQPQTAEIEPAADPITNLPTEQPETERAALPTPVVQVATQTPTATATTQPTETPLPTSTPIPPTSTPVPTEVASPMAVINDDQEAPRYAVVGVAADDVLQVRSGPGVDNDIVDQLPHDAIGVELIGEDVLVGESSWREIQYLQTSGWVNRTFLAVQYGSPDPAADTAHAILTALKDQDFETLATYVHPEKGVRFSPYTFVEDDHVVLIGAEVSDLQSNSTVFLWGSFDGTGDPISLTFAEYYDRFIYDAPFYRPHSIGFNEFIGFSSTINNQAAYYPETSFVEYHFSGFEEDLGGLDWRSLRLVLEPVDEEWKLVGVVHSESTT